MSRKFRRHTVTVLALLSSLSLRFHAQGNEPGIEVTPLWKTFSMADASELTCVTAGRDDVYWAAGTTHSREEGTSHWWGQLSADGKRVQTRTIWSSRRFRNSKVVAILQAADQSVWVVGETMVARFKPGGEPYFSRTVSDLSRHQPHSMNVSFAIAADDGGLLLCGYIRPTREDMNAWLLRVDAKGDRLWEESLDHGQDDWIVHGLRKEQHFVLVAISGKSDKFGSGFDRLVITECTDRGEKVREHRTEGFISPDASPVLLTRGRQFLLACSRSAFPSRDAWVLCLDSSLEPLWEKRIAGPRPTASSPSLSLLGDSTLILTWNTPRDCRLWRLDERGEPLGEASYSRSRGFYVRESTGDGQLFLQGIADE